MLTNEDLKKIDDLFVKRIDDKLKPIKDDIKQIRHDVKTVVNFFDSEYLELRGRSVREN